MHTRLLLAAVATAALLCTPVLAKNRKVDIINKTRTTMTSFYASSSGTNSWEEDMLDDDTLAHGETLEANIDDGTGACVFDFKAVFEDGDVVIKKKVNVCKVGTFTFSP
jgi:hypothetical protein